MHFQPYDGGVSPRDVEETRSAVDRVRQPMRNFSETEKYKEIREFVELKSTLILHCHGVPGSGKSEIIRKLAEQFPYTDTQPSLYVKWHIQCIDSGHDVKTELKSLVETLHDQCLLPRQSQVQHILKSIDDNLTGQLTSALRRTNVPTLIIIEDVKPENKKFMVDFFRSLENSEHSRNVQPKFHIYMTTHRKTVVLSQDEYSDMNHYRMEAIKGFNRTEGVGFLLKDMRNSEENKTSAEKVCDIFSGSPLGLRAARTYCKDTRITYADYLRWLDEYSEGDINDRDQHQNLEKEYGNNVMHVFRAIAMPFHIQEGSDNEAKLMWKVLSCLSYFHYDRIPLTILKKCCEVLRDGSVKDVNLSNKIESGKIISKLLDHEMCTETDEGEVTFHRLVMRAFKHDHLRDSVSERLGSLRAAIYVIAGLLTKDLRDEKNSRHMDKLIRHTQSLLDHIELQEKNLFVQGENLLLDLMMVSHVYESFGAIASAKAHTLRQFCDSYFEKALKIIWKENHLYALTGPERNSADVNTIAKYVVEKCDEAGDVLPTHFLDEYQSKLWICLDKPVLKKLERQMKGKLKHRSITDAIDSWPNSQLIQSLRECQLFLNERDYRLVFFVDRLTSILHSWSRVILYKDNPDISEYDRYIWFSSLVKAISTECRLQHKIALLPEYLCDIGGMIPIILKQKPETEALLDAKIKCDAACHDNTTKQFDWFEHGVLKEVDSSSDIFLKIQKHRNLVRIYTRLVTKQEGHVFITEANENCDILYKLTSQHACTFSNALMCIIYCAKYYAASGNFTEAITCFQTYFEKEKSIPQIKGVRSWAIYNYARAVLHGKRCMEKDQAILKCKYALQTGLVIQEDLGAKIESVLSQLENMNCENLIESAA